MAAGGGDLTVNTLAIDSDSESGNEEDNANSSTAEGCLWVVAIDFGTTYSGYAFSSHADYNFRKDKIGVGNWTGVGSIMMNKTPTTLLLDPAEKFVAFGTEAEDQYQTLASDGSHTGYHYFKHFKMSLHKPPMKLSLKSKLKDDQGQEVLALTVFAESIAFLKRNFTDHVKHRAMKPDDDDINWVLTVPAIWDEDAKKFMKKAAEKAGIKPTKLWLALEPEAASVYCKEINLQRKEEEGTDQSAFLSCYDPGTKYMVVDLGGGTADITVRKVMADRSLQEVFCASGGPWGGMTVNKEFWKYMASLVGGDKKFAELLQTTKCDELDIERDIECQKRELRGDKSGYINIKLGGLFEEMEKTLATEEGAAKKMANTIKGGKVKCSKGKLKLPINVVSSFFKPAIEGIVEHLRSIFKDPRASDVHNILLVGGFAESKIVQDALKTFLRDQKVVIPENPDLAVLKGAVMYGHNPGVVSGRLCPKTFGTENLCFFMDGFHDPKYKKKIDNAFWCEKFFNKLIEKDTLLRKNEVVCTDIYPVRLGMDKMSVNFYQTENSDTRYIDEPNCRYLGKVTVDLPKYDTLEHRVVVSLKFGETDIIGEAYYDGTQKKEPVKVHLNLLQDDNN